MNLDPRTKLWLFAVAISGTIATRATPRLAASLAVALLAVVALRALTQWLRSARLLAPMLVVVTVVAAFPTPNVETVGPALKLLALATFATALFAALPADELGDAFTLLRFPPAVSFVLVGGLRYAPMLAEGWRDLLDARRARGATIPRGARAIPAYAALAVPAVVRTLRTADDMAEAMEARGFGAASATLMRNYRLCGWDWLLMGASLAALLSYLAWWR